MIDISEAATIALHSMIYIAERDDRVIALKEIAHRFNISEHHLSKVLQRLIKAGFLQSIKGPKGGFKIVESKKYSSFMDVYESIEGKFTRKQCLFKNGEEKNCCCVMGPLLNNLYGEFETYMNSHKINEFKL